MILHIIKYKRNSEYVTSFAPSFGSTQLAVERELCILGVTFDSKLLWSRHISDISKKAGQRLGALRKIANKLDTAGKSNCLQSSNP